MSRPFKIGYLQRGGRGLNAPAGRDAVADLVRLALFLGNEASLVPLFDVLLRDLQRLFRVIADLLLRLAVVDAASAASRAS